MSNLCIFINRLQDQLQLACWYCINYHDLVLKYVPSATTTIGLHTRAVGNLLKNKLGLEIIQVYSDHDRCQAFLALCPAIVQDSMGKISLWKPP